MTPEILDKGTELLKRIKECREFLQTLDTINPAKDGLATVTITSSSASSNPSIRMCMYQSVLGALKTAMTDELNYFQKQFDEL